MIVQGPARLAGDIGVLGRWAAVMRKAIGEPVLRLYYGMVILR